MSPSHCEFYEYMQVICSSHQLPAIGIVSTEAFACLWLIIIFQIYVKLERQIH